MKSLVIYFSHTGENYMENGIENIDKGNTEIVADTIKEITGADLFKVETVKNYPYNYKECCEVAEAELNNNIRPELKEYLDNIDNYDIIYIGGPVWYGHYPCAIFSLLEKIDFTKKTVKPFTTHEGSGLGNTMEDINKYCLGANIMKGLEIRGCKARTSKVKIEKWCL